MAEEDKKRLKGPDWLSILSLGFFLVLLSIIWIITPNLTEQVKTFFTPENWRLENVTENIAFPKPEHNYPKLYTAAMQFCYIFGIFHIAILALRLVLRESLDRMGGTVSSITFWLCAGFFLGMLASGTIEWFSFLAGIIISIGLVIIISSIIKLYTRWERV